MAEVTGTITFDNGITAEFSTNSSGFGIVKVTAGDLVSSFQLQPGDGILTVRIHESEASPIKALVLDDNGQVYPAP